MNGDTEGEEVENIREEKKREYLTDMQTCVTQTHFSVDTLYALIQSKKTSKLSYDLAKKPRHNDTSNLRHFDTATWGSGTQRREEYYRRAYVSRPRDVYRE